MVTGLKTSSCFDIVASIVLPFLATMSRLLATMSPFLATMSPVSATMSRFLATLSLLWTGLYKDGQVFYTYVPLSPSSITWYRPRGGDTLRLRR